MTMQNIVTRLNTHVNKIGELSHEKLSLGREFCGSSVNGHHIYVRRTCVYWAQSCDGTAAGPLRGVGAIPAGARAQFR